MIPIDPSAGVPEVIAARVLAAPSAAVVGTVAAAYNAMSGALGTAASGSDGSMSAMSVTWTGPSSDRAQSAFKVHADWLRTQAAKSAQAGALLSQVAEATASVQATMADVLVECAAIDLARPAAMAVDVVGTRGAAMAALEVAYNVQRVKAIVAMAGYSAITTAAMAAMPAPSAAPTIVGGGSLASNPVGNYDTSPFPHSLTSGPNPTPVKPVPIGKLLDRGPIGENPVHPPNPIGTQPDPPGPGPGPNGGGQPTTPSPGPVDPGQSAAGQQAPPSATDSARDAGAQNPATNDGQGGFYGTSPNSSTLSGLNGGVGSAVPLSMVRGGLGTMAGSATGFRMPANWKLSAAKTFGAGAPAAESAQPAPARTAPRGASVSGARRRRRDEETRSGRVFAPGEPTDVPTLEQEPAIGVIENADADDYRVSASESLLAVAALGHDADWSDPFD
ncbi:PPE domain-containing protein [Nocardia sp. NBC_00511]|uniref:PPE domain-containing protein n=1 Tax=Nocardia sp. NBC_00511 TaxID=2903591 RepID=UPI0030E3D592